MIQYHAQRHVNLREKSIESDSVCVVNNAISLLTLCYFVISLLLEISPCLISDSHCDQNRSN